MADDLDLDPAFDDVGGGMSGHALSMSMADEQMSDQEEVVSTRRGGRSRRGAGARQQASEELSEAPLQEHLQDQEGFSLADELAGGADPRQTAGDSLGDELNGLSEQLGSSSSAAFAEDTEDRERLVEAKARRDQEHYLVASESLAESVRATEVFLSKLSNISNISASTSSTTTTRAVATATNRRQSETNASAPQEDTSGLEQSAATIVKQLREHTAQREMQVRELREAERVFARGLAEGGDWLNAMGSVDEDWASSETPSVTRYDSLSFLTPLPTATVDHSRGTGERLQSVAEDEAGEEHEGPMSPRDLHVTGDGETPGPKAPASQQMKHLQQCTSSLISSLGMLHEHSQVARAEMGDAARRLRSLKTVLVQWRTEVEDVERSRSLIAAWEGQTAEGEFKRPDDIKQWTKQQMERFEKVLTDAETRAKELLQPVPAPKLDELAKQAGAGGPAAVGAASVEARA
ncbi:hypothetical protein FA10DRAFT_65697 [Acaromyces ingoldii]|uniref:Uncharacterized protein n=1 Tax=Acaromyces ingoldii TaxID=215250 RepID=A0A316YQ04_9BASI|nr:hypothetical protein FA10DRAFT_65697 [Acaromyces ingoldii]PWN91369.1 hypothetical protein FA10DRAFT_65697 [Acaromyces ingoldii]